MSASIEQLRDLSVALGNSHDLIIEAVRNLPEKYRSEGMVLCETIRAFRRDIDFDWNYAESHLPMT